MAFHPELLPRIIFSSFDYNTLARLRVLLPGARLGLLTRDFNVKQALALGARSIHINQTRFTPEIAGICHKNNLKIYVYTVNDLKTAAELEENERNKAAAQDKHAALEAQKAVRDKWAKLRGLMGNKDGSSFSIFVQGITFRHLLKLANKHLALMKDRYELVPKGDVDFEIVEMVDYFD